jgi:hypothetical protein
MVLLSRCLAGATSIVSGMPHLSTAIWILTPRIFLPRATSAALSDRIDYR